jgi:hypothetical protein
MTANGMPVLVISAAVRWISLADGKLASPDEIDDPTAALRFDRPSNLRRDWSTTTEETGR